LGLLRLGLAGHFLLPAKDAAPVFMVSDGHSALDAHANALFWLSFLGKQFRQKRHFCHRRREVQGYETEKPPVRFAEWAIFPKTLPVQRISS
jgi:hypothetical protein